MTPQTTERATDSSERPAASTMHREKRSAALGSLVAAVVLTSLKLTTGLLTGSLGMLSEAAHSGLDLIAAGITLFSVQVSDRPADEDHTYGHGKIENLSAFFETFLMLASCVWIVVEAINRIFLRHAEIALSVWPFAVLVLSIAVDFSRSHALMKVARRHGSEALEADAMHFGTDIWSSTAVLAGLAAVWAGARWNISWLQLADPVAALAVSAIILKISWALARRTIDALLDAAPAQTRRDLIRELARISGVMDVDRLRLRRSGNSYFADVTLGMARNLTFQKSQQVVEDATNAVQRMLPGADVVVHTMPRARLAESIFDRVRAVASRSNLTIHDVSVQQFDGKLRVELHMEVEETLPLRAAHDLVSRIEAEMLGELPEVDSILTHIESEPATIERPAAIERDRDLEARLRKASQGIPEIIDIHDVVVSKIGEHVLVSCHCTLPDDLPMTRVHELITSLESSFKLDCPEVYRVLIHPEPATDNRR
ncbi:MAG: cation diffusion facilitator family transporter [Acidobacteriaceae bacterium]